MDTLLHDLKELLQKQVENLQTLAEVLRNQRACLLRRDVAGIIESVGEQEECLTRIQHMEEERGRLLLRIGGVLGMAPGEVSLTRLRQCLAPAVSDELLATAQAIGRTLQGIGRVNLQNKKLIERSLDLVQDMLGAVGEGRLPTRTYESSGTLRPREQSRSLVNRVT